MGLQQLLELLLRNWLWYSKLIWLHWHIWYLIRESRFIMSFNKQPFKHVVSGTELSESQRCPIPVFIIVSNLRTSIEWLSATTVLKPRQLIQRVSASLVFLSTTFSGKTTPFISTSQNKTKASAMVLHVNRRSATLETSRSAARASGCFFVVWRHRARGLLSENYYHSNQIL